MLKKYIVLVYVPNQYCNYGCKYCYLGKLTDNTDKYSDITSKTISFVPMMSVVHSVNNTLNKLSGSHFSDGISSAIVNPSESSSDLEKIVRR